MLPFSLQHENELLQTNKVHDLLICNLPQMTRPFPRLPGREFAPYPAALCVVSGQDVGEGMVVADVVIEGAARAGAAGQQEFVAGEDSR
jgi:hypothetical protein